MHTPFISITIFLFLISSPLNGLFSNYVNRALDKFALDQGDKDIIIDYFDQMGSYDDWKNVTSIKINGKVIFNNKTYAITLYKKLPNKFKIIIQDLNQPYPRITQIMNDSDVYCYIQNLENNIEKIAPIFDLKEDMHIFPKMMHLLIRENENLNLVDVLDLDLKTLKLEIDHSHTKKHYTFYVDKTTKYVTKYTIKNNLKESDISLEGTVFNGRLGHPRIINYEADSMTAKLILNSFNTNLGLTNSFFEIPKSLINN